MPTSDFLIENFFQRIKYNPGQDEEIYFEAVDQALSSEIDNSVVWALQGFKRPFEFVDTTESDENWCQDFEYDLWLSKSKDEFTPDTIKTKYTQLLAKLLRTVAKCAVYNEKRTKQEVPILGAARCFDGFKVKSDKEPTASDALVYKFLKCNDVSFAPHFLCKMDYREDEGQITKVKTVVRCVGYPVFF